MSRNDYDDYSADDDFDFDDKYQEVDDFKGKISQKKARAASRRRVEDILEERRMREELDDMEFYLKGDAPYFDDYFDEYRKD